VNDVVSEKRIMFIVSLMNLAPKVFTIFFNLVKTILHEVTVNKFRVFG
jgi:hypothetical protein